jgi:dihydroorotase
MDVVTKLTQGPAMVLGHAPASLIPGTRADLVVFDPDSHWTVDTSEFASKGKNSPLHGQQLKGQVMLTMLDGDVVFRRGNFGRETSGGPHASRLDGILTNDDE